jgi:hypothetical protein
MMAAAQPYPRRRSSILLPLAVFTGMITLVLAAGLLGYSHELSQARAEKGRMLATVADLKVRQVSAWLDERRSDAELALHDEQFAAQTEDWLMRGAPDDATGHSLKSHLQSILLASQYHSVMLLDRDLMTRAAAGTTPAFNDTLRRAAQAALQKTTVTFVYDRADAGHDQRAESFTLFAPLRVTDAGPARVVGLLALSIDPNRYLYPLLDWWPTPASSGVTYLLRREGEQLTNMSGARDAHNQHLTLPTRLDKLLSAQTLRNQTTLLEGLDIDEPTINALIKERNEVRGLQNWARSDEIRDRLLAKNIELKDGPEGTTWGIRRNQT